MVRKLVTEQSRIENSKKQHRKRERRYLLLLAALCMTPWCVLLYLPLIQGPADPLPTLMFVRGVEVVAEYVPDNTVNDVNNPLPDSPSDEDRDFNETADTQQEVDQLTLDAPSMTTMIINDVNVTSYPQDNTGTPDPAITQTSSPESDQETPNPDATLTPIETSMTLTPVDVSETPVGSPTITEDDMTATATKIEVATETPTVASTIESSNPTATPSPHVTTTSTSVPPPVTPEYSRLFFYPFFDDMENGESKWVAGDWKLYHVEYKSASHSWENKPITADEALTLNGRVNLSSSGVENPVLVAWMRSETNGSQIQVLTSADTGKTWGTVKTVQASGTSWYREVVDLSQSKGQRIVLRFVANGTSRWWIDDVAVQEARTVEQIPTPTPSRTPTATAFPATSTKIVVISVATATPSPTRTVPPTMTKTHTPTKTLFPASTRTPTATVSSTSAPSQTPSATETSTSTSSRTPTPTLTHTSGFTPTATATTTPSETATPTLTMTSTPTAISTFTPSPTTTYTPSYTPSYTPTRTITPTASWTPVPTATSTPTQVPSATNTPQPTWTRGYLTSVVNQCVTNQNGRQTSLLNEIKNDNWNTFINLVNLIDLPDVNLSSPLCHFATLEELKSHLIEVAIFLRDNG